METMIGLTIGGKEVALVVKCSKVQPVQRHEGNLAWR